MVITACAMAFAHGSNDVANAIGPLSAVVSTIEHMGEITAKSAIAWWILPLGGFGIVVGLATMGHKMATVGTGITELNQSRGFRSSTCNSVYRSIGVWYWSADFNHSNTGWCGSGCGFARGIAALNLGVVRNIVASWIVTLPAGAISCCVLLRIQGMFRLIY